MARAAQNEHLIHEFLGSAHVFSSAVNELVEKRLLEEVAGKEITLSQFKLLKMVSLTDAQTITDVGLFLGVSNAAASKAVDKLVRQKLLRREEGHPDRREIRLSLTEASRRHLLAYDELKRRRLVRLFRQFPAGDLKRAARLLDRLSAGLVGHAAKPEEVCLQCGIYFRDRCLVRQLVKRDCFYHRNNRRAKRHSHHGGDGTAEHEH